MAWHKKKQMTARQRRKPGSKPKEPTTQDTSSECWTAQEIEIWLRTPPSADLVRVEVAARAYSSAVGASPDDLKQEAYARLLARDRSIKRRYPLWQGLVGIIRSLAYDEGKNRDRFCSVTSAPIEDSVETLFGETDISPAMQAQWRIDGPRLLSFMRGACADRPILQQLLEERIFNALGIEHAATIPLTSQQRRASSKQLNRRLKALQETIDDE